MMLTSPVWWFYLNWSPGFFADKHGLDLKNIGPPLIAIYLIADVGSIAGGWISSTLIQRGWSVNAARKLAMLACVLCVVPVLFAPITSGKWVATLLIALAAAAHQGWAANLYTLVSDTMPRHTVSSVVGIGGMAGAVAGMFAAKAIGYVLEWTHSYVLLFATAPAAYLLALGAIQILLPRIRPTETPT
jgi:ACS family hexuronate transporter-like MFS transporter